VSCALGLAVSGCLVTDKVEYREQNYPPRITERPPPIAEFPQASQCDPDPMDGDDTEVGVAFRVEVEDPNVDDVLRQRIIVNGQGVSNNLPVVIPPTGKTARAPLDYCIRAAVFRSHACNLVEVLVANDFTNSTNPPYNLDVEDIESYDTAKWLLLGPAEDSPLGCVFLDGGLLP